MSIKAKAKKGNLHNSNPIEHIDIVISGFSFSSKDKITEQDIAKTLFLAGMRGKLNKELYCCCEEARLLIANAPETKITSIYKCVIKAAMEYYTGKIDAHNYTVICVEAFNFFFDNRDAIAFEEDGSIYMAMQYNEKDDAYEYKVGIE